jgi:hypothetical protein
VRAALARAPVFFFIDSSFVSFESIHPADAQSASRRPVLLRAWYQGPQRPPPEQVQM